MDFHNLPKGQELLCLIGLFSSFPIVIEVSTTAHHYVLPKLDEIFSLMGIPEEIRTDNGPPFKSLCEQFDIKHIKTTPEWPQETFKIFIMIFIQKI